MYMCTKVSIQDTCDTKMLLAVKRLDDAPSERSDGSVLPLNLKISQAF